MGLSFTSGGLHKQVGNGKSIKFLTDPWIPKEITFKPIVLPGRTLEDGIMVEQFITPSLSWDIMKLQRYVTVEDM